LHGSSGSISTGGKIPVDLETLPMMLKFGIILDNDFHNVGQSPTSEGCKTQA
jgi:hypothetical protein